MLVYIFVVFTLNAVYYCKIICPLCASFQINEPLLNVWYLSTAWPSLELSALRKNRVVKLMKKTSVNMNYNLNILSACQEYILEII